MEKIRMVVKELKPSRLKTFYDMLLTQTDGNMAINISIGEQEADNISIYRDKLPCPRPLIYDIVKMVTDKFSITLKEIVITDFFEGNFLAKALFENENGYQEIDIRPSDAVNLALRYNCPIYALQRVIDEAGFSYSDYCNETSGMNNTENCTDIDNLSIFGINMLNDLLKDAIEKEDYVTAAVLRDKIKSLNQE